MVYSSQVAGKFMCYYLYPQFLVDHFTFHIQNTNFFQDLKHNSFHRNCALAFGVAEKELGIPALLDVEDLVQVSR